MNDPGPGCHDLLRAATVALEVPGQASSGPARATGFFVAPGIAATCAHVLSDTLARLPQRVAGRLPDGRSVELETVPEWYLRSEPGGPDLAFLRAATTEAPYVLLSDVLAVDDPAWVYGHPVGQFRGGEPARFTYLGPSRLREGGPWTPHRLTGTPVGGGFSGSPVLNQRTGAVCGMLCTSDERGSAHMVAAGDILAGCPPVQETQSAQPNVRWLRALTDQQISDGGWLFPGPRLRAYLTAAAEAAKAHPYPGVAPGIPQPPLAAVYVRQQAEIAAGPGASEPEPDPLELGTRPAEEILSRGHDCVIIGGPGAGKSSLLRTALISIADRWLLGGPGPEVPVHVPAADLLPPRPLPNVIADSVTANLSLVGSMTSWPPEFFADQPLRGVRWLILVDGLDEILDPDARRGVLNKIAGSARTEPKAPYRFIVATRPLDSSDYPGPNEWRTTRYELLPFDPGQLAEFAGRWFTELRLPAPLAAVRVFIAALDRARLTDLARTPLMATILCQLFAARTDQPLPAGRSGAYAEFVDLLRRRQYEDRTSGIYAQTQVLLGPYGPAATAAAGPVLATALDLIARLAFDQREGGNRPAVDLLAEWTEADRPRHVPPQRWRSFVREILRRSGLLTQRADDFHFIHQTVSEYLAAQHVTADADLRDAALGKYFRWTRAVQGPELLEESYVRFLVAAWPPGDAALVRELRALVSRKPGIHKLRSGTRLTCCRLIAALAADSALPDPGLVEQAAADLVDITSGFRWEFLASRDACEILAQLGDPRGSEILAQIAADRTLGAPTRLRAAEALVRIEDSRGADLLAEQAGSSAPDLLGRRRAAETLATLGDPRSARLLVEISKDPQFSDVDRADALIYLVRLVSRTPAAQLVAQSGWLAVIAIDPSINPATRLELARALVEIGDRRGADALAALAEEGSLAADAQLGAARILARIGDSRAFACLVGLAGHLDVRDSVRLQAVAALTPLGGADILARLACDPTGHPARYAAAEALARIGDSRYGGILRLLVADPTATAATRLKAASALIRAGHRGGADGAAAVAADPAIDMSLRFDAAWVLVQARDRRASLLRQILTTASPSRRRTLVGSLDRITGGQALPLLQPLTADWRTKEHVNPDSVVMGAFAAVLAKARPGGSGTSYRLRKRVERAVEQAWRRHGLSDGQVRRLFTLFHDQPPHPSGAVWDMWPTDDFSRRRAAEALAWAGDPQGKCILAEVAQDSAQGLYVRLDAVQALARLGEDYADLLVAMTDDESSSVADRLDAAIALFFVAPTRAAARVAALAAAADSRIRSVRTDVLYQVVGVMERVADANSLDALADMACNSELDDYVSLSAAEALSRLGDDRGVELLALLADDESGAADDARIEAAEALAGSDAALAVPLLVHLSMLRKPVRDRRAHAAEVLARLGDASPADHLAVLCADDSLPVFSRVEVGRALLQLRDPRAGPLLSALADDSRHDPYARKWAADALGDIGRE